MDDYGIYWLGKQDAFVASTLPTKSILEEDSTHDSMHSEHLLIKGDNLDALKLLMPTYEKKIKMIYIDPPYNTGRSFLYSDKFKDKDKDRRSAWLSFMYPRLLLAKKILKDDGMLFISIDENADSQLRILLNEIFGEDNFLGSLPRKTRSASNNCNGYNLQHESLFIVCKNKDLIDLSISLDSLKFASNPYMNQHGTKELLKLGLSSYFSYPKCTKFLYDLIKCCTNKNDLILDFFAGSGTTGEAVMQINADDGGDRKFILVQIADMIDQKKNYQAYDFVKNELSAMPTIFEITKERLIRASKAISKDIGFKVFSINNMGDKC